MGAEGAVDVLYQKELTAMEAQDAAARRPQLIEDYQHKFGSPYLAASRGYLDAVIRPSETRESILSALRALNGKRRSGEAHRNIPL